jgi:hypothetical protein
MIDTIERCRLKADASQFQVRKAMVSGLWVVWEDFGGGIYKVVADFVRQDYAEAFVLSMLDQAEVNWP